MVRTLRRRGRLTMDRSAALVRLLAEDQADATPLRWLIILSPLAFIMVMSFGMNKLSTGALQAMFLPAVFFF